MKKYTIRYKTDLFQEVEADNMADAIKSLESFIVGNYRKQCHIEEIKPEKENSYLIAENCPKAMID